MKTAQTCETVYSLTHASNESTWVGFENWIRGQIVFIYILSTIMPYLNRPPHSADICLYRTVEYGIKKLQLSRKAILLNAFLSFRSEFGFQAFRGILPFVNSEIHMRNHVCVVIPDNDQNIDRLHKIPVSTSVLYTNRNRRFLCLHYNVFDFTQSDIKRITEFFFEHFSRCFPCLFLIV